MLTPVTAASTGAVPFAISSYALATAATPLCDETQLAPPFAAGGAAAGFACAGLDAPAAGASAAVEAAAATVERKARRVTGSPVDSQAAAIADSPIGRPRRDARGRSRRAVW